MAAAAGWTPVEEAPATSTPAASGWTPVEEQQPSATSRFLQPLNPMSLVHQIFKPSDDPNEHPSATFGKNIIGIVQGIGEGHIREAKAAKESYDKGNYTDAIAHGLAALTPIFGPLSQDAAEKINKGDVAGGLGTLASMAAPEVAEEAAPMIAGAARTTANAAGTAARAVGRAAANPLVREAVGVVSPRAAHGLALAGKGASVFDKLTEALSNKGIARPPGFETRPVGAAALDQPVVPRNPVTFEPMPEMPQQGAPPLPRAKTLDPDVAKTLNPGTQRVNPDGSVQVLAKVPIDQIDPDAGNEINPAIVRSYKQNGYSVQPELSTAKDGRFTVKEGHHRITADAQNGKTDVLAWVPEKINTSPTLGEQQAAALSEPPMAGMLKNPAPQPVEFRWPNGMSDQMEMGGQPIMPKSGPLHKTAAQFEIEGRGAKAKSLAGAISDQGITHEQLSQLAPEELQKHFSALTKALGINKTGHVSMESVSQTMNELKWLEERKKSLAAATP